ncbi:hypothetical protein TVAG_237450 [Trichomonas vaginalis G3]|uniref:Metallo-beta-lactamase domain-containing protein n=1 Tax=Trichomonas vaginalis (strain ATCC PRA-98 / G3) TaxID=412133 RepID=A2DCU5_TRIV3|nr:LRRGT00142-related family [Trichomonas vaginalis G3]EAY21719.1 hypothetical protein TVAG_237450 [Trichomonas vaginalis G3]KAI5496236.1 LRRGT00142-related family [Trichomonas vaginalis G3]|eukprot:XP_001582705.1 hypothetical protein [Trichomonas vaginalis G3]
MSDIVSACKKDSFVQVEKALSDPKNINEEFSDKNGKKFTPLTWACEKGIVSLVEMMVKKGANPNVSFIQSDGKEIAVIDWASLQDNGSLLEVLLKHGCMLTPYSFQIAQTKEEKNVLYVFSDKIKETIKRMYKSHNYMAFEDKLIDFSTDNLYVFAFNTGQANFLAARRHNKVVIVDAGEDGGEIIKKYRETKKDYAKVIEESDKLIFELNKFLECPGKVKNMFKTNSRAEPKGQYRKVLKFVRKTGTTEQKALIASIENMTVDQKPEILEIIEKIKDISRNLEKERQRQEFNLVFDGSSVEQVFITHSHLDHFSYLDDLFNDFGKSFQDTKYLLGGEVDNWKGEMIERLFKLIGKDKFEFIGREYDSRTYKYLDGLDVKVWGQDFPEDLSHKNQISLFVTIDINGRRVMFTGDAEGCHLKRLRIDRPDMKSNTEIEAFLTDVEATIKQNRLSKTNSTDIVYQKLKEFKEKNKFEVNLEEIVHQMLGLEETVLIFEPHHGSLTENSHDVYKYFSSQNPRKVFCILSYPQAKDYLPKKESFDDRVKEPKVKEHPVVYAAFGNIPTMNVTTDPVYTTGACGDGMYVFSLSQDGEKLSVLDLTGEKPQWEKIY